MTDRIATQLVRYVVVGLASNGVLFLCYLGLTWLAFGHKVAMTICFLAGVLQTFLFNRRWSFEHRGASAPALVRYTAVYVAAYVTNLFVLVILVDLSGLPHQWVQAVMIGFVAIIVFLLQRYWVFVSADEHPL